MLRELLVGSCDTHSAEILAEVVFERLKAELKKTKGTPHTRSSMQAHTHSNWGFKCNFFGRKFWYNFFSLSSWNLWPSRRLILTITKWKYLSCPGDDWWCSTWQLGNVWLIVDTVLKIGCRSPPPIQVFVIYNWLQFWKSQNNLDKIWLQNRRYSKAI